MWLMRSVAKLRLTHISFKLVPQTLYTAVIVHKCAAYIFDCYQMLGFLKKKQQKNPFKFKLPDSKDAIIILIYCYGKKKVS